MRQVMPTMSKPVQYACMPLIRNVPKGRKGWKETTCSECGVDCWETERIMEYKQFVEGLIEIRAVCTLCALRKG